MVQKICAGLDCPEAEVSVVVTDDAAIWDLNRSWRRKDKATDVLSFSQLEGSGAGAPLSSDPVMLGDVVISFETAARQALAAGCPLEEEVKRLLIHGILHLLGHDHVRGGRQARRMRLEEKRLWELLESREVPAARRKVSRGRQ